MPPQQWRPMFEVKGKKKEVLEETKSDRRMN